MSCIFCNIDTSKIENTIIEESRNFYVMTSLGSLVDGYLIIVSKKHLNSMSKLSTEEITEYQSLIDKYRKKFKKIYNKYPIVFEHGCPILNSNMNASSIIHAHSHIVNHNFIDENSIMEKYNFKRINSLLDLTKNENYIMYLNDKNKYYLSNDFPSVSQLMRKLIADDLGYNEKYDWKKEKFIDNIDLTIKKFKNIDITCSNINDISFEMFNIVKKDYDSFDLWLNKMKSQNVDVYYTKSNNKLTSIMILKIKEKDSQQFFENGNILKIRTLLVNDNNKGIGKEYLKIVDDIAVKNDIDYIYCTVKMYKNKFIDFLLKNGYKKYGKYEDEYVYYKELK